MNNETPVWRIFLAGIFAIAILFIISSGIILSLVSIGKYMGAF